MSKSPNLSRLIELAKGVRMSEEQTREQRNSFVYGNTRTENQNITRDMVDRKGQEIDDAAALSNEKPA